MKKILDEVSYVDETIATTLTKKEKQELCKVLDDLIQKNKLNINKQKVSRKKSEKQ